MAKKEQKTIKAEIANLRVTNKKGNRVYEVTLKEVESKKEHIRYIDPAPLLRMRDGMGLEETSEMIGKQIEMSV